MDGVSSGNKNWHASVANTKAATATHRYRFLIMSPQKSANRQDAIRITFA
jgi:hypothetical protein